MALLRDRPEDNSVVTMTEYGLLSGCMGLCRSGRRPDRDGSSAGGKIEMDAGLEALST